MAQYVREGRPRFTGVTSYQDPLGRFSFRYPSDWRQYELDDELEGSMLSPVNADITTYIGAWVAQLDTNVVAEDLDILREGIEDGLASLPDLVVEKSDDTVLSNLVKFERIYTFTEDGETRRRRAWMLYVDKWRIVLIFQGSSIDEYEYWLPMGNYAFATFDLPQALWFATDRDLKAND
ncbi:hypothetical protein [Tenggerimyces flavus]|uniref:Uncharacterized protein n=1 Tax=Tenggerimyces flavus TaxID=1708749 RepID=A0ABV7YAA0_9ACTN|nr:hypothetical protein [Tenggerimyces flavus]MBM7785522.1 hypothetical protein [Tenggerimyces flavus]